jgi:ABC-2 type transport system permease protein
MSRPDPQPRPDARLAAEHDPLALHASAAVSNAEPSRAEPSSAVASGAEPYSAAHPSDPFPSDARFTAARGARRAWGWPQRLRLARVLLATHYAEMTEYRAQILLWALSGVLPLLMLAVWSQLEPAPGAVGLSREQLDRYFLSAFLTRQFTVVWLVYQFEEDALHGRLSLLLLQPLAPLWRYLASHLAEQATRLPVVLAILAGVFLFQPGSLWLPPLPRLLAGLLAIALAFTINFLLHSGIASLCFWSERASALERLILLPHLFLSGLLAPLSSFPPGLRAFAEATPFPWMLAFPARVLAVDPSLNMAKGFAVQILWIALLLPVALKIWRSGVGRYTAMGG